MEPARAPAETATIELGDLQLLIHRRQFPDAFDRWDGNWLHVTARCTQSGAMVAIEGPILEGPDLERFRDELSALQRTGAGQAQLSAAEPHLVVRVAAGDGLGHLRVRVELTSDPATQGHWFAFLVDPRDLVEISGQLDAALDRFPVRGRAPLLDPA